MADDLDKIFNKLKKIIDKHKKGLVIYDEFINSKSKVKKQSYHLYGKKEVSIFNKKPQQTFICGIVKQKNYVGFYYMPIYSEEIKIKDKLKKTLHGKTCFYIKTLDKELFTEIDRIIKVGIKVFKANKWI